MSGAVRLVSSNNLTYHPKNEAPKLRTTESAAVGSAKPNIKS